MLVLATAVSTAAFIVPLTAPSGWAGAPDGAIYACTAWLAVLVAAVVRSRPGATDWLVTVVVASAAIEFMSGWLGWWGGEDPAKEMVGTFYWHNPYAAFLVPGGLVGLAFWIWRERAFALLGLLCFTFAAIGIVYSASRASLAVFVLGLVLVTGMTLVGAGRLRAVRQLLLGAAIAVAAAFFVGGPPFFPHRASPLAAQQARPAEQSLASSGNDRLHFWQQALRVFRHHPVTGGGFKSLVAESYGNVPRSWTLSPYTHNGYLQPLGEGGLVLGVPFLLAVLSIAYFCLRTLVRGLIRQQIAPETVVIAAALACVMLHSGVDFDWTYAADFAMAAVLAGLVVGQGLREQDATAEGPRATEVATRRQARIFMLACLLAGVVSLGLSAWVIRHGNHTINLPVNSQSR